MTETESLTLTLTWHVDKYKVHKLQRRHIVNKACPPVISATSTDTDAHLFSPALADTYAQSFPPLQQTQMHIHFCHFNRHRCTFISATSTDTDAHSFPPLQQTQMRHFNRHRCATSADTNAHSFPPLQQTQMRHFNRHRCATSTDTNAHSFPPLQQTQMRHFNRHKCTFISATSTDTDAATEAARTTE